MNLGIMCHSSCGGSARIAIDKAMALARRSHTVHLFVRSPPFMAPAELSGVALHTLNGCTSGQTPSHLQVHWSPGEMEAMIALVLQVISEQDLEVLHVHYALPFAFIAREIGRRSAAASPLLVATLHGTDVSPYGLDPLINSRLADTLKSLHVLTTISTSLAGQAAQVFNLETTPRIIPGFVDSRRFSPPRNRANGGRPKILHISNFRPIKTPQAVARIFFALREQIEAELWLVGDGEEMDLTKNTLQSLGLENDVHYWGLCRDVSSILRQADLLVMPSRSESFCLAALEAMACGVPVLASDVGGLPEVVIHNRTGFLFPSDDYAAAVHYAVRLLKDPVLYQSMSAAAVRQARRFDQEQIVSLYENLYYGLGAQEQH